ncbi:MAG: ABC transporter substrate-binding protein [Eggerthellaceae bacterium]|nr:ABC transporter substrate-binding protein [Eggerthellaceae bacterium]
MKKPTKALVTAFICALTAALAFAITGCSQQGESAQEVQEGDQTPDTQFVTDVHGRSELLPIDVTSAATVGDATRYVAYVGGQDKLTGVTDVDKQSSLSRPYTVAFEETFSNLTSVSKGSSFEDVNTEELKNLAPDVILATFTSDECDKLQEQTQIPVIALSDEDEVFADAIYESIACAGKVLGCQDKAQELTGKMDAWAAELNERVQNWKMENEGASPTVYLANMDPDAEGSWTSTFAGYAPAESAGVLNVADELGVSGNTEVTLDQIAQWDPQFIFASTTDYGILRQDYQENQELFSQIQAVQGEDIYTQPVFISNGANIDTGLCEAFFIASVAYEDEFEDWDMEGKYKEIYEAFLGGYDFYGTMRAQSVEFWKFPPL